MGRMEVRSFCEVRHEKPNELTIDKGNRNTPSVQLATFSNYLRSQYG